ncbi:MAG: hypothetical protein ACYTJ0_09805, partial [Planctomycetota bacterium]
MTAATTSKAPLGTAETTRVWWPLAASWMLMGLELPALSAVVARLDDPTVHLAAFGGLVFPLALIIESPIIMMLAASTALSRDWPAYRRLKGFMWRIAAALTALHVLLAFTPLYDLVAIHVIGAPEPILEPGRLGLQLLTPWTWAIADRRFNQGVLIRCGRSSAVGIGTAIRLVATCSALLAGLLLGTLPGIAVATAALSVGVLTEAVYVRIVARPIMAERLPREPSTRHPLSFGGFLLFYVPLALTPLLQLLAQPIGSAAISRMPDPLLALAAWPALHGIIFLTRSFGIALNEVVVSLWDRPGAPVVLWRFAVGLGAVMIATLLLLVATPLARVWFGTICGLAEPLTDLATAALWLGLLLPGLSSIQSYFQGLLVHEQRTRAIPESVALFLIVIGGLL